MERGAAGLALPRLLGLLSFALLLSVVSASAQVSLTGLSYSENFDSLGTTNTYGSTGWTGVNAGTSSSPEVLPSASTGSNDNGGIYNFGSSAAPADRALGSIASGSIDPAFGAVFTNNTGSILTSLTLSFRAEQWRTGSSAAVDTWEFQFKPGATSIGSSAFTSPVTSPDLSFSEVLTGSTSGGAVNGNAAENSTLRMGTISGFSIAPGGTFAIRWVDTDTAGADAGMGIDNFTMSFQPVPEPSTVFAVVAVLGLVAWRERSRIRERFTRA